MMTDGLLALLGGGFIGLAAVLLMASHGKIMGISGILSRVVPPIAEDWLWRAVFLLGVVALPITLVLFTGNPLVRTMTDNTVLLVVAGLLVGAGTVTGNGCTSGHGVCGLSRLSVRSLVAVMVFMFAAFLTVFIARHILGA